MAQNKLALRNSILFMGGLVLAALFLLPSTTTTIHLPIIASQPCPEVPSRRGVAPLDSFADESLVPYQEALCLPDGFPCFTWAAVPRQEQCWGGETIPMVYAGLHNIVDHYPPDYDGLMLFANEADLEPVSLTPQETAALACEIQEYAPDVQLVGPAYSPEGIHHLREFWEEYAKCSSGDSIVAHAAHIYAIPGAPYPQRQLEAFYSSLPPAQRHKPVYVHETGFNELALATHDMGRWLEELDRHPKVEAYGWFTAHTSEDGRFDHWVPLVDRSGNLTSFGKIFSGRK